MHQNPPSAAVPDFLRRKSSRLPDNYRPSHSWEGPFCPPSRKACRARLAYLCNRILLGHAGFQPEFSNEFRNRPELVDLLGVPEIAIASTPANKVYQALARAHASGVLYDPDGPAPDIEPCVLQRNLHWIRDTAQLNPVEYRLFELAVLFRVFDALGRLIAESGDRSISDHHFALAALLQLDPDAIKGALRHDAVLLRCSLIVSRQEGEDSLNRYLRTPNGFATNLEQHTGSPETLLQTIMLPLQQAHLGLEQFAYTQANTDLAQSWLAGALASAARGEGAGHLLVVGSPGLGKTEWVRAMLHQMAPEHAMEMAVFHVNGTPLSGTVRLQHLRMAMHFLRSTPQGVLIFDEADDIFREHGSGDADSEEGGVSMRNHRASLNQLLETSRIPVVWIMNDAHVLDPAVLRRFDAIIRFEPMPRHTKRGLLETHFGAGTPAGFAGTELDRWAQLSALSPGLIAKLAEVHHKALLAGRSMDAPTCRQWLVQRMGERQVRDMHAIRAHTPHPFVWNPQTVNASMDLAALMQGIRNYPHARVLLHGLPGTGKTAYAKALAQALGQDLHEHRASDLLSAFVGGSEEQIDAAFASARTEGAMLFLDEADGLLASRDSATRNWEITQVNELLMQLHDFEGVVVLATNRLEYLDDAVLRRMDAKVELLPLKPAQSKVMLFQTMAAAGQKLTTDYVLPQTLQSQLQRLHPLTPGDFAMLQRRLRFAPLQATTPDAMCDELLGILEREVRLKSGGKASIGFVTEPQPREVSAAQKEPL